MRARGHRTWLNSPFSIGMHIGGYVATTTSDLKKTNDVAEVGNCNNGVLFLKKSARGVFLLSTVFVRVKWTWKSPY